MEGFCAYGNEPSSCIKVGNLLGSKSAVCPCIYLVDQIKEKVINRA